MDENRDDIDATLLGEMQLILSEKRTALSMLRTGIAVFVIPLSVLSVLIATSSHYVVVETLPFLIPVLVICLALAVLGSHLILRSIARIRHYDSVVREMKRKHRRLSEFVD